MILNKKRVLICLLVVFISFPVFGVFAQDGPGRINNPLDYDSFEGLALGIITWIAGFADVLALLMLIIGGFQFMFSAGNPDKVAKAKKTIVYSLVGLLVATAAWSLSREVLDILEVNEQEEEQEDDGPTRISV